MLKTLFLTFSFLMATNTMSDSAALLTVYPTGNSSYIVYGSTLEGVAGIDLTIAYDTPELQNPVVSQGALVAGAFMAVNTGKPGEVRAAIMRIDAISGSGQIVAIQFSSPAGSGDITSATAEMIDENSATLPVSIVIAKSVFCDNGDTVTIAAVQSAINMFLGIKAVEICVDTDYNGTVSIAEVQKVINGFLGL